MQTTPHTVIGVQFNSRVGDLAGNALFIGRTIAAEGQFPKSTTPKVLVFPEMGLAGYPLQDLARVHDFADDCWRVLTTYLATLTDAYTAALIGFPYRKGKHVYNAVAFCAEGKVLHIFTKTERPNDSVFDEVRTFKRGRPSVFTWQGITYGVMICEDGWHPRVARMLKRYGAQIILSPNGSPYHKGKEALREKVIGQRVTDTGLPVLYVNRWGGQDELGFDGQSFLMQPDGSVHTATMYADATVRFTFNGQNVEKVVIDKRRIQKSWQDIALKHHVTVLRDYAGRHKSGKIVIGLSGGIDSALVLCLAVQALGKENIHTVGMPYGPYSSSGSVTRARALAEAFGISFEVRPIDAYLEADREVFADIEGFMAGITEENLQARARGRMLMALSNAGYGMVLTTGNKSEMCVGYSTLYGDMNGGFNPIKDLYKMEVFALCTWLTMIYRTHNPAAASAMQAIIDEPPSAELRPDQKDTDSLPPYDILDRILEEIVEHQKTPAGIRLKGIKAEVIEKVYWLVRNSQFKRRQSPPGTRWHAGDLDKDYRQPLDNGWKGSWTQEPTFGPLAHLTAAVKNAA